MLLAAIPTSPILILTPLSPGVRSLTMALVDRGEAPLAQLGSAVGMLTTNGWCGDAVEHCGVGCQAGFGECDSGYPSKSSFDPGASQLSQTSDHATLVPAVTPSDSKPPAIPVSSNDTSPTTSSKSNLPSSAKAWGSGSRNGGGSSPGAAYSKQYTGDGSSDAGWPGEEDWLSFGNLWEINQRIMDSSCSNAFSQEDNSGQELANIKSAIEDISVSSGVDKSFILAIMMQESNGCVRAPTTAYSHANPGLFQSNQGGGTCNDGSLVKNPCPEDEIYQMIEDGVQGTAHGDGLKQLLGKATGNGTQRYYRAARMYNSGSVDSSGNLGLGVATHCYCSDIANRLIGWSQGVSKCDAESVGS
ncbi:hypothetical protein Q7P37_009841 [Cladosporium fusiforme]